MRNWYRYAQLQDRDWLYNKYVTNKTSSNDIAKELKCTAPNVIRALRKFDIERRTNSEAQSLVEKDSKYALLNDPEFLKEAYNKDNFSTITLAKIVGAKSCNSVRQYLIKNNIEVRNTRDAQIHSRQKDGFVYDRAVLDGGLLGDASLGIYNKNSDLCMPYYKRNNKFYDHIFWVAKQLITVNPEVYIGLDKTTLNSKKYVYPVLRSQSHKELLPFFKRWYPENNSYDPDKHFMKLIPEDVDISPVSLLHCFLDDGSTYRRKREKEGSFKKQVYIALSLQGFPKENLEMLCEKFKKQYGNDMNIKTRACYTGYGYSVEITQGSYHKFMDIIGPCPPELISVFGYKWK